MKQSVKKRIENKLQEIMPGEYPGDFNQALMELGAVVCVPNGEPKCDVCPVAFCCGARAHGTIDRFPVKAQKKDRKLERSDRSCDPGWKKRQQSAGVHREDFLRDYMSFRILRDISLKRKYWRASKPWIWNRFV